MSGEIKKHQDTLKETNNLSFTGEQLDAIMHGSGDILVSASAGSGKTMVMIERILRLILEKKAAASEILAVTFTISAADEMREKLKKAIAQNADSKYMKEQIRLLSTADISTIHSFCTKLIRTYFFLTDLGADFEVLDEKQTKLLKEQALKELFNKLYNAANTDFLTLTNEFKKSRSDNFLKKLIIDLYDKAQSRLNPIETMQKALSIYDKEGFDKVLGNLFRFLQDRLNLAARDFFDFYNNNLKALSAANITYADTFHSFLSFKLSAKNFDDYISFDFKSLQLRLKPAACEKEKAAYEMFKKVRDVAKKQIDDEFKIIQNFDRERELEKFLKSGETARRLVLILTKFDEVYNKLKVEENKADFDDLQHKAIEILKDKQIRAEVLEKYKYVFTDEYQDVNEVQETVLNLVADKNLFMVGDLKQSIYTFRGCDPKFFASKHSFFEKGGGKSTYLNKNFRSSRAVIDAVNSVFCSVMTKNTAGVDYEKNAYLTGGDLYNDYKGKAVCHILQDKKERQDKTSFEIYDILKDIESPKVPLIDRESLLVADTIIGRIGKEYYDIKSWQNKKITYSDIAVLSRSRKKFTNIKEALAKYGIPYISDVKDDILIYPEIKFIVELLRFIDNFEQDIPTAAVLKYIGKLKDDQLASIKIAYRKLSFYQAAATYCKEKNDCTAQKIAQTFEYFQGIKLFASFEDAAAVIGKIFVDYGLYFYFASLKNGDLRLKRIERFLKEAEHKDGLLNCQALLQKIESLKDGLSFNDDSGQDAVKLMTIHSAKGLEYPIVIIPNLSERFVLIDEIQEVFSDNDYGIVPKFFDLENKVEGETILRRLIKLNMRRQLIVDEINIFYVALTRAKCELHLICSKSAEESSEFEVQNANCLEGFLKSNLDFEYTFANFPNIEGRDIGQGAPNVLIADSDKILTKKIKDVLNFTYKFNKQLNLPSKISVTAAAKPDDDAVYLYQTLEEGADKSSQDRGSAYHIALENIDFNKVDLSQKFIDDLVASGKLEIEFAKLINLKKLKEILNLNIFKEIENKTIYKEREFFVNLPAGLIYSDVDGEILVQGVIDLIAEDKDGAHIIDYKYSTLTDESLIKRYAKQLLLYKAAYERISGKKVKSLRLFNILSLSVINII